MIKSISSPINIIKFGETENIPKRHLLDQHFWFVNAGILSNSIYEKAVLFVGTYKLKSQDFLFVLFLGIKYLIHYIELFIFDNTPLLIETILKHLRYLQSLLGTQRKSKIFLNYRFIVKLQFVFNNIKSLESKNFVCRQIYIDQLEKFCHLFAARLNIWVKSAGLQAYLYRYGYDPCRSCVIYNSFLIPNQRKYIDPLCRIDQKFIEKIEVKCNCKIMLSVESIECFLLPEYVTFEVAFDLYRGNYLGFLDMFGYVVKQLNPTQYFAKSLRTVLIEGSILYNILTNVPVRKLRYLEKSVNTGCPVTPFLSADSISKQLFSIVALLRDQDGDIDGYQDVEYSQSDGSDELSKAIERDLNAQKYYAQNATVSEMNKLQEDVRNIKYSQNLLNYFKFRYDKEMIEINNEKLKAKEIAKLEGEALNTGTESVLVKVNKESKQETMIDDSNNPVIASAIGNSNVRRENSYSSKTDLITSCDDYLNCTNPLAKEQKRVKDKYVHVNISNTSIWKKENTTNESKPDFKSLSPLEQFRLILSEPFYDYSDEHSWINHKLRLMLRCDTEHTIEDIKYPFIFQRRSIKERLDSKIYYRHKVVKQASRTQSASSVSRLKSDMVIAPPMKSWISKAASRLLSGVVKSSQEEKSSSSSSSNENEMDILNERDLKESFPEIFAFLEKYGKKLIDKFIDKKLYKKQDWVSFLGKHLNFSISESALRSRNCDFDYVIRNITEKNAARIEKFESPLAKRIFTLLLLLTKETITNKDFREISNGRGINFAIIDKINKSQSSVPTHIGNLDEYKPQDYLKNLSRCMCQMMYDLVQIAHESSQDLFYILKFHIAMLDELIKNTKDKNIQSAFKILNIRQELSALDFKTYVRGYGPNISMIYLAEELSLLHDIIFKYPCCSYKLSKHLGLHIVYHSLKLDDRLNAVEPFFKLPGDRRIRKIEKMCNCIIALRTNKHPTITINEYVVDIFYDFDTGNHFGAIDLLKQMMTIQDHRTLVAYPSGELWAFRDTEWLKKCYYVNENDAKILAMFKNNDDLKGELSPDEDFE